MWRDDAKAPDRTRATPCTGCATWAPRRSRRSCGRRRSASPTRRCARPRGGWAMAPPRRCWCGSPSDELGIVTDADVRAAVAGGAVSLRAPVRGIARSPVPTVPARQLAIEAAVDMVAAGAEHLVVVDGGRVVRDAVGGRPARARRAQPDRAAPHDPSARPTRTRSCAPPVELRDAVSAADACGRAAAGARPGAQPPARRDRRPADRLLDPPARAGAACRGPGWISAAPPAASSRSPPIRTTRSPTRPPSRTRRTAVDALLRAARLGRQRRPGPLRDRARQQRRARRQAAVADVRRRLAADVR